MPQHWNYGRSSGPCKRGYFGGRGFQRDGLVFVGYYPWMQFNDMVAAYIMKYHTDLLTEVERRSLNHLVAEIKGRRRNGIVGQEQGRISAVHSQYISDDPDVLRLARDGYRAFYLQTARRIFQQHGDKLSFNCCPRCAELARTPTARQCRFCGHDWHRG